VTPQNWQTVMSNKKVVSFFFRKIGVTPSVAAPGDTHPSDATGEVSHTKGKSNSTSATLRGHISEAGSC